MDVPEYVRLKPDIPPPRFGRASRARANWERAGGRGRHSWGGGQGGAGWTFGLAVALITVAGVAMLVRGIDLRRSADAARRPEGTLTWSASGGLPGGLPAAYPRPGLVWSTAEVGAGIGSQAVGLGSPGDDGARRAAEAQQVPMPTEAPTAEPPTPTEPPTPVEPPTPPAEASIPIVPTIDAAAKERLRQVYARGQELGLQSGVFAKVGDSITVSSYFLDDFGCGGERLGDFADLADTVGFFRAATVSGPGAPERCASINAFTRASLAAGRGWIAVQLLSPMEPGVPDCPPPDDTPLRCEVRQIRPAIALVMVGTNDVHQRIGLRSYQASLATMTSVLLDLGVIPVLSTLPHRLDSQSANARLGDYNAVVRTVAQEKGVPLWNYWRALEGPDMVRGGMEPDGIHPNAEQHGANLSPQGLRYGYNQRNLGALQVLDKLRRIVIEDGPPDS